MSISGDEDVIAAVTRTSQIIVGTLVGGLVSFLVILLFLKARPAGPLGPQAAAGASVPIITYAAIAFAAASLPASILIPRFVADNQRRSIAKGTWTPPQQRSGNMVRTVPAGDAGKLASVYLTTLIAGAAMNEGPGFFALVAYLLEGQPLALILALGLIAGVALRFPTRTRVDQWIEPQLEQLNRDRQLGD